MYMKNTKQEKGLNKTKVVVTPCEKRTFCWFFSGQRSARTKFCAGFWGCPHFSLCSTSPACGPPTLNWKTRSNPKFKVQAVGFRVQRGLGFSVQGLGLLRVQSCSGFRGCLRFRVQGLGFFFWCGVVFFELDFEKGQK